MTPLLVVTGPTAVGKSSLVLEIAERIGGEIVSVDSRQIYRGLDIGTAKPGEEERARVRHHFVDERALNERVTAGGFAQEANARIATILERGRRPILAGGSTLYLAALVHGLAELPPVPDELAGALAEQVRTEAGCAALFDELARADPDAARTLDASKSHRLARLVGVLRHTGAAPSSHWARTPAPPYAYHVVVLDRPRDELYARIEQRVDAMLHAGLLDECRSLSSTKDPPSPLLDTIGYREPIAYLRGESTFDEMVAALKRNTRRYAKRQLTWFRRYPGYHWLDARESHVEKLSRIAAASS